MSSTHTPQNRPRRSQVIALAVCFLAALVLSSASAQAARVHKLEVSGILPNGETPGAVAVDQVSHHIYITAGNNGNGHVYNFNENGEIDPGHPELTPPLASPFAIAVDNSGGPYSGYIYVTNSANLFNPVGTVQQFNPEGEATAVTITEGSLPPNGTAQAGGLPPVVNNGSFEPRWVAVDPSGNIFVIDRSAEAIDVFTPAGVFVRQIGSALSVRFPEGIAVDGANLYLAFSDSSSGIGPGLFELDATTGECVQAGCAPIDPAPIRGVAVSHATGIVYTAGTNSETGEKEGKFSEYEASTGQLLGVTHPPALLKPRDIGVDEASGKVIVADENSGTLDIFGPLEIVPDVETLAPEEVSDRSVTLKGKIGAAEVPGTTCIFQYSETKSFEGAAEAPCEEAGQPAGPFSGSEMHEVEAKVSGLRGGTAYHERILGTNANGSNPGEDISFETKGPSVTDTEATEVEVGEATLKALVDPNGADTTYRFQYLTQASFEASGWSGATEVPAGGEDLGSGTEPVPVSERIEGLAPHTEYRFRVLATSSGGKSEGETQGEEVTFSTFAPPTTGLPDGRRYEQASPVDKNGSNVQGGIDSVQASLRGDRITFVASGGIPGGEGAQNFPTFLASRAPDSTGWSSQGLLPPATLGPQGGVVGWTEDLENIYEFAARPSEGGKLLRRQSSDRSLTQIGTIGLAGNQFGYAGSSQGGKVALLETKEGGLLPNDLEGKQNLYAYGRETGALVLAGVMNDGSVPPGGAMAGPYDWFKSGSTAELGGALNKYYTQSTHTISADGSEVFFTAGGTGQLYVRLNPLAAQSAMSGEQCTEAAGACTVRISAPEEGVSDPATPAAFLGASSDGRLVYFLDRGKLTQDSTAGAGSDLYRYDVDSGDLTDLTRDSAGKAGARVEGMLGIGGPTGEDAYFAAAGALTKSATQAPAGKANLYALHGTTIEFVTRLETGDANEKDDRLDWTPTSEKAAGESPVAHESRLSADGQTLLFRSTRQLTSYHNHGVVELYLYRAGQGIDCISCNPTGEAPAGPAGVQQTPLLTLEIARTNSIMTRNLSADGRRAFFDSSDRLVSADHNNVNDVYEWEAPDPTNPTDTCTAASSAYVSASGGCLYLISGGAEGAGPSYFGDADESGENAFFFTAQQLVAQDRDELVDVYDARVGGGIAAQEEEPKVPCEGEAGCRGVVPPPPSPPSPGSTSFTGPGNPKPPAPCPKVKVRRKGHCVAKHKHHKKHKHAKRHGRGKGGRR